MTSQKQENKWTTKVTKFEGGGLQVVTATTLATKGDTVVLKAQTGSGQNNAKSL